MPKVSLKKGAQKQEEPVNHKAQALTAYKEFEKKRAELRQMKEQWETDYPEAKEALEEVQAVEDEVHELISAAKPLMAASKEKEIGEFKMVYPKSSPTYNGERLLKLLVKLKSDSKDEKAERFDLLVDLFERGLITEFVVDSSVAALLKDKPSMKPFNNAWEESHDLAARVTVPKI